MRFFGRKKSKKSFDELVNEYYETHKIWSKEGVKRQFEILKQLPKMAKNDKERILVNSLMLETKRRMSASRNHDH